MLMPGMGAQLACNTCQVSSRRCWGFHLVQSRCISAKVFSQAPCATCLGCPCPPCNHPVRLCKYACILRLPANVSVGWQHMLA